MKKAFAFLLVLTLVLSAVPMMASASYVTGLRQEGKDILAEMNDVSRAKYGFKPSAETEKHFGPSQKEPVVNNSRVGNATVTVVTLQDRIDEYFKTYCQICDILEVDYDKYYEGTGLTFAEHKANALEYFLDEAEYFGMDVEEMVRNYVNDLKNTLKQIS